MIHLPMEHPVPQNVTSFEFHLVGDMTLRQFGYLAAGCTIAYIIFVAFFARSPYLSTPAIAFFALFGIAFAFLPIADRPLDHWVKAFFRAVYLPTEGSWQLSSKLPASTNDPVFKNRLQLYLSTLTTAVPTTGLSKGWGTAPIVSEKPSEPATLKTVISPTPPSPAPSAIPSATELNKLVAMAGQIQGLKGKIVETEQQISQLEKTASPSETLSEQQYQQILGNLQNLLKQTEEIYQKTNKNKESTPAPTPTPIPPLAETVAVVPTAKPIEKLPLLTSSPNVINGLVTDPAGNLLEGVIIIVHNKDGIPVRALKTNKLGQFTGATPLPDGAYSITFEKDSFVFDTLQVSLAGEVLPAVKVFPKGVARG